MSGFLSSMVGATYAVPVTGVDWLSWSGSSDVTTTFTLPYGLRWVGTAPLSSTQAVWIQNNTANRVQVAIKDIAIGAGTMSVGTTQTATLPVGGNQNPEFHMSKVNANTWVFLFYDNFYPVSVSGSTHTVGSQTLLSFGFGANFRSLINITNDKLILNNMSSTNGGMAVITYSGGTFTKQNEYTMTGHQYMQIKKLSQTKFVLFYRDSADGYQKIKLMTVSGNTASFGSATTVDTSITTASWYDYQSNGSHEQTYTTSVFGTVTSNQIKLYPITESSGALTLGTTKTINGPNTGSYQNYSFHQILPLDGTHWMLDVVYQNSTTAANKIHASKILKVETNGTITEGNWITNHTTTTGGNIANIFLAFGGIDSNKAIHQWIDGTTCYHKLSYVP